MSCAQPNKIGFDDPAAEKSLWIEHVRTGDGPIAVAVVDRIARLGGEEDLVRLLRDPDPLARERATAALWVLWHRAQGPAAERALERALRPLQCGSHARAIAALDRVVARYPNYAEAWNKRATAHYLAGRHESAVRDCHETLRRNPVHFGAWHGLGLCLLRLHRFADASAAFHRALVLQPHEECNRQAIAVCERQLSKAD